MRFFKKNSAYFNNVWPLLAVLLLHSGCSKASKNFTNFLYDLAEIDVDERSVILKEWLKNQEEFPIIDGNDVYFVFKEKREIPIYLVGDMIQNNLKQLQLMKIIGTDYYYIKQTYPLDSAIEYRFLVNGRHLLDPLNKRIFKSDKELSSLLFMPDYIYPIETLRRVNKVYTKLDTLDYDQNALYLYRHVLTNKDSPVIFFLNGKNYLQIAEANILLDNLINAKEIPPCIAVFPPNDSDVLDLLLFLKKKVNLSGNYSIIGANKNSGLELVQNPEIIKRFSALFIQSGFANKDKISFAGETNNIDYAQKRIFLSYGFFEKADSVYKKVIGFLQNKSAHLKYETYNEGASWFSWKGHLKDALIYCIKREPESSLQ